jgi:uncharacterized protein (DUF2062 family)
MSERLKRTLQILLQLDDSPHRIALSFAIGVAIAFSPFLGIHTGLALAIAWALGLSRAAMLIGAYVNNPWTIAPMYTAGTLLGCYILGVSPEGLSQIEWKVHHGHAFYEAMFETLRPYVLPFALGNSILGVVAAVAAYFALRSVLDRRRQAEARP